ncbi:MAG: hypothetical protein Q8P95_01690, partial [bacterium]|nr:hypothetical protein [bacterium]
MNRNRILKQTFLILALALVLALTANPWKLPKLETNIPLVTPLWNWIQDSRIHLGLDLQGGTQLDYEIDLKNAHERNSDDNSDNDVDVSALLEGVKDVIERRVNSLGVAEPNIYLSSVGEEWHIVVELPGIKDLEVAKQRVGEVVQLQFKTEKAEAQPEEVKEIEQQALALLRELEAQTSVEDLEVFLEDKIVPNQVEYKHEENLFLDQLPVAIQDLVDTMKIGEFYQEVVRSKESGYIYNNGQFQQPEGLNIVRLKEISTELRKRPINAEPFDEVLTELEQKASDEWQAEENITPVQLQREIASLDVGQITGVVETEQ